MSSERPSRSSHVRFVAAAATSGVALWLAIRTTHLEGLRSSLAGARLVWLLPYPILCIVLNLIRGEIWRLLLRKRVSRAQAFWAYAVGFLTNNILPLRIGEVARIVVLSTRAGLPVVEVGAGAGLERLLDLAALSVMLVMLGPALSHLQGLAKGAVLVGLVVAGGLLFIAVIARFRDRLPALVSMLTGWLPSRIRTAVLERSGELMRGLVVLLQPRVGIPAVVGAGIVWFLTVVLQWLVLRAFQPAAGMTDAAFMVAAVSLAIALPALPGFIGVYHWAGQLSLMAAFPERYDPSTALAAATVAHAVSYLTSTAIGLVGLWYFGLPPSAMARVVRHDDEISESFDRMGEQVDGPAVAG